MPSSCRNPECREGLTPGIVIRGRGNAKLPVLGQIQTWGWVRCRSCNASDEDQKNGAIYKHVERSREEIAMRAARATNKETYKAESAVAKGLGSIRSATAAPPPSSSAQLDKLLEQVTKLTEQVTELLGENRALRKQLEAKSAPDAS